jgi:hypothetical protein
MGSARAAGPGDAELWLHRKLTRRARFGIDLEFLRYPPLGNFFSEFCHSTWAMPHDDRAMRQDVVGWAKRVRQLARSAGDQIA